jgi:hypothetical protein
MIDSATPAWIQRKAEQLEREKTKTQIEKWRTLAAEKAIKADGPDFWRNFLRELQSAVMSVSHLGLQGSMEPIECAPSEGHKICVSGTTAFPGYAYMHVFFDGGGAKSIRCDSQDGRRFNLRFCLDDEQLKVQCDGVGDLLTAERAAELVMDPMTNGRSE